MSTKFLQGLLVFFISLLLLFILSVSIFFSTPSTSSSPFYLKLYLFLYPKVDVPTIKIINSKDIPTPSIYIVKEQYRLYLWNGHKLIQSYPIGLGKNNSTPTGHFFINQKLHFTKDTSSNPYGPYVLELSNPNYAIHGTRDVNSIGQNLSHGCIRMKNNHIKELFTLVSTQTPIYIIEKASDLSIPLSLKETLGNTPKTAIPLTNQEILLYQQQYSIPSNDIQTLPTYTSFQWKG